VAASWWAVWGLYSAYYWTNDPAEDTLQTARFYVQAMGAISLLGAWLVTRIPGRPWLAGLTSAAVVTAMFGLGAWSFHAMVGEPVCVSGHGGSGVAGPACAAARNVGGSPCGLRGGIDQPR
jgi:hypothetical protein